MKTCAVIPAAGRGTRLGADRPKIFMPISEDLTIWGVLARKLAPLVDHIHVILSPEGAAEYGWLVEDHERASYSVQPEPLGMGDAIFTGYDAWSHAQSVLIVWGDQVFVSQDTLRRTIAAHALAPRTLTLPLTRMAVPYVEYMFDDLGHLQGVRQSREGDACDANGYSDVGAFLLSTDGLREAWREFAAGCYSGARTGELNFLPFLPFLSGRGWSVEKVRVADAFEARGINTPADLEFFRRLFEPRLAGAPPSLGKRGAPRA